MTSDLHEDEHIAGSERDVSVGRAFRSLLPLLRSHIRRLILCFALLAVVTLGMLGWPMLLRDVIDGPLDDGTFDGVAYLVAGILSLQIVTLIARYYMRIQLETVGQDIMLDLKQRLNDHILSLDVGFFDSNPVGRIMARVESDTEALRLMFTQLVVMLVGDAMLIIGIYAYIGVKEWRMALILAAPIPVIALMTYVFHRLTTHRYLAVRKKMAEVTATLTELIHGMSIIQIFHRGRYARGRVYRANESKFRDDAYVNVSFIVFFNVVFFFEFTKIGLVLLAGPLLELTAGMMLMLVMYIWFEYEPVFRMSEQLSTFQKAVAGARRIFSLLSTKPRLVDPVQPVVWPGLEKAIAFENVSFAYGDDGNWALRNVSFEIARGQRVALAGVTGGGKSTVISLLLRYYDPQEGRITVDGIDIRDIHRDELRARFALVLQDILLFPGTVADNIGLESEAISRARIEQAAGTVAATSFIERLPGGFETEVSEKGANFSRGERQLLSFARALAVDPDILILDEATSSVDPETERTIQESLKKLMASRTSLIIAHRLSTILDVDQILVIRRGEIIERGTHTELILKNGYYSRLFHLQFKYANGVASNG